MGAHTHGIIEFEVASGAAEEVISAGTLLHRLVVIVECFSILFIDKEFVRSLVGFHVWGIRKCAASIHFLVK